MRSTSPIFHPSIAKDYFRFTNNLSKTNDYIWYDSNKNINLPTTFNLSTKKTVDYNLKLYKAVFDGANKQTVSLNPAITSGKVKANKFKIGDDDSTPTIDLYFQGDIQKANIKYVFKGRNTNKYGPDSFSVSGNTYSTYSIDKTTFPQDGNITFSWVKTSNATPIFSPVGRTSDGSYYEYRYDGDNVSITTNWGTSAISSDNSSDSAQRKGPTGNLTNLPTVYCTWTIYWKPEVYCDECSNDCDDCPNDYDDCPNDGDCPYDGGDLGTVTVPGIKFNPYTGEYGRDGTEVHVSGNSYTHGKQVFIPEGTYPIVSRAHGWEIFEYDGGYATIP